VFILPIFFGQKLLKWFNYCKNIGAYIKSINESPTGLTGGINLLHASIVYDQKDDRLFDYFLEQGFNPKERKPIQKIFGRVY
jgi:hypothetical protein